MSPAMAAPEAVHDSPYPRSKAVEQGAPPLAPFQNGKIIDIRRTAVEINLKDDIFSMWNSSSGPRELPTLLLYNEKGLQLFEDITYLDEYYLTNNEIEALQQYSKAIAEMLLPGSMIIELGSGNLRKVCLLLQAFEDAGKKIDYYALDLSRSELDRTLAQVPNFKHVKCHGLWGTYDDGREWLQTPSVISRPKCILSLGSSIGNFGRDDAAQFLKSFGDVLQPADSMLIGVDGCDDPSKVYHAYNDKQGITHQFILNGLSNANDIIGKDEFNTDEWKVVGEYVYDDEGGRHRAFYSPVHETEALGSVVKTHDRIQVEQSLKYSPLGTRNLWNAAGMAEIARWVNKEHSLHLLIKPRMPFKLTPSSYASGHLPTLDEWAALWSAWDIVTKGMLPKEDLHDKPIKLRNACIFYLGHIPTFLDIQLTKTTGQPPTEPALYYDIFERGIDPDVDNPEQCHAHSEIPDEWPPVNEITEYQQRVRSRLRDLYKDGREQIPRSIARAIWVGFEHEIMHMETLLYMMLQSDKTQAPPNTEFPDFEKLAKDAVDARVENEWHHVPEQTISIGMVDPEDEAEGHGHFGWDNEKPPRTVEVPAFQAKGRGITNQEFAHYLYHSHVDKIPASWIAVNQTDATIKTNGSVNGNGTNGTAGLPHTFIDSIAVRTVYGPVPLKYAMDWPVFASYDELSHCAAWMGGRIPTFEEAKSIYNYVNRIKKKEAEQQLGKTVPAVNGHLSNNGVQETPPPEPSHPVGGENDLFIDLEGANVGFQHWHPQPVTAHGGRLAGQSEMGGVWEWTSSPLRRHEGFEPMALYPAYTVDFFDEKHNIVLGGSWATHPRIAGRKSFVNWYQRNYPYAWVGARLVRDAPTRENGAAGAELN